MSEPWLIALSNWLVSRVGVLEAKIVSNFGREKVKYPKQIARKKTNSNLSTLSSGRIMKNVRIWLKTVFKIF